MYLLFKRRFLSFKNGILNMTLWDWAKRSVFGLAGLAILVCLYFGFVRVIRYLETVQLIGEIITWKLTALALLTTFWMVAISNVITAISTLYYADDLGFLLSSPTASRAVFMDKAVETAVYASWMVGLALVPYILALGTVKGLPVSFYAVFVGLSVPFLALSAAVGIVFTVVLMYFFPSSRTRDVVWILSSLSMALVYVVIRVAQPERLARPDVLDHVVQYLDYLQAPTAAYLPSWWITQGLVAFISKEWALFWKNAGLLVGGGAAVYFLMAFLGDKMYHVGLSGAQEGRRYKRGFSLGPERSWKSLLPVLLWKDRTTFFRDVRHWSQLMLILALVAVYLFSVRNLPLDTPTLRSLASFLNIGATGFVIAALGLRFTFPAISLEGKNFWVVRAAPLGIDTIMLEKFLFSVFPMTLLGGGIVFLSNYILGADAFVSVLSLATMIVCVWTLCGMGIGFGAMFPKFQVENIHQIESSAGGFIYMACGMGYIAATVGLEAWIVRVHFMRKFSQIHAWDLRLVAWTAAALVLLNLAAFLIPWMVGRKMLENFE